MDEKIQTLHPAGKQGVNISRAKYDQMRAAILAQLRASDTLGFGELMEALNRELEGRFAGSIGWYVTTVKLDLEARGEIERVPGRSPQQLRLAAPPERDDA